MKISFLAIYLPILSMTSSQNLNAVKIDFMEMNNFNISYTIKNRYHNKEENVKYNNSKTEIISENEKTHELFEKGIRLLNKKLYFEAFECMRLAALKNHIDAQINLGIFYETGTGTETSLVEAVRWYSLAFSKKDKEAEKHLSRALKKMRIS